VRKSAQTLASIYVDVPALRPGTIGAYSFAFVCAGIASALQVAIDPYLAGAHYITFFLAIVITTLIGGFGAGLFCLALSAVAVDFFLFQPHRSLHVDLVEVPSLLIFILAGLSSMIVITGMRLAVERKQLQASKAHLQLALDAARLGWWRCDLLRHAVWGDPRFKEIFGLTCDEMPEDHIKKLVHSDDAERFWVDREASLDPTDPGRAPQEYRVQRRDGEVRWVEVHRLVHFEGAGRARQATSFVATAEDVTEREKLAERDQLLMREINHRAKNMLSVVDAIAHQTAARTPEDFIERFSERIQALSANQDLLIRNAWHGVEAEDLVRAQLAPFADHIGARIVVCGPKLRLNATTAQAIGLALHELTTNAGKYGALSKNTGRLDVGWGTEGDTFTMSWTERDGPPVSQPQRRGFGTIVMQEMAQRSVDGGVELDYGPSGVTWRSCPTANVLEPLQA
jgi:PAS domain S-box-containing protein